MALKGIAYAHCTIKSRNSNYEELLDTRRYIQSFLALWVHQSEIKGGMQNIYQYQLSSSPINLSRERMISRHFNIGLVKPQLDVVKS